MPEEEEMTGKRILVVDDDADFSEATGLVLKAHGYRVFHTASGREALAKRAFCLR